MKTYYKLLFLFTLLIIGLSLRHSLALAADRYWVGGSGTWDGTTTTNWATSSGGAGGASVPTLTDNVFFDASSSPVSYTVTTTSAADGNCLDITIGNPASGVTTVAGNGNINVAGNFSTASGVLWTISGGFTFKATSGIKTITTNGDSVGGGWTFNGIGGTFQLADNFTWQGVGNSSRTMTLTNGTFDSNGKTVTLNGAASGAGLIQNITGAFTFYDLTLTVSQAGQVIGLGSNITVTHTLAINGPSATTRVLLASATLGTQRTITITGTTGNTYSNVDFRDIDIHDGAGQLDLSAISGGSGDVGGNNSTDMKLTASVPQYWHTTSTGTFTWSTAGNWFLGSGGTGGAGRVPLAQDDVYFDSSSVTGNATTTVQINMPLAGRSVDFTGITAANKLQVTQTASTWYTGSITLVSGMGWLTNSGNTVLGGRGQGMPAGGWTITSAGLSWNATKIINAVGDTYKLMDAFSNPNALNLSSGTFDANGFNVTISIFLFSNGVTVNMGSGTWTLTSTGGVWNGSGASLMTINAQTSTIAITNTTTTAKTFAGAGLTYNNLTVTGDNITVTGANTFNTVAVNNAGRTNGLLLTAGTTQTVRNMTTNATTTGATAILKSATASSTATIQKAGGSTVCLDFMTVTDVTGVPANTWYMGANSTLLRTVSLLNTACPVVPAATSKGATIQNGKIIIKNSKVRIQPQ